MDYKDAGVACQVSNSDVQFFKNLNCIIYNKDTNFNIISHICNLDVLSKAYF